MGQHANGGGLTLGKTQRTAAGQLARWHYIVLAGLEVGRALLLAQRAIPQRPLGRIGCYEDTNVRWSLQSYVGPRLDQVRASESTSTSKWESILRRYGHGMTYTVTSSQAAWC